MIYFNIISAGLTKLVTKSILLLENIGGKVVGLANDGTITNLYYVEVTRNRY